MSDKLYPLSLPQKDIYFEQLLFPDIPLYNIGAKVEVRGNLDFIIFKKAVTESIRQYDSLRSVFVSIDGIPYVRFSNRLDVKIEYIDFSFNTDAVYQANQFIQNVFQIPFDLKGKCLLNEYYLFKINDNLFYIFGKFHHLISDGWGTSLLFNSLSANYTRLVSVDLPVENISSTYKYSDFIEDDLQYLQSEEFIRDTLYWKNKFSGLHQSSLSVFKTSIRFYSYKKELVLLRKQYNEINTFCADNNITTFHFLFGLVYLLLTSFFKDSTIVTALPLLNRRTKKFKETVGLFSGITPFFLRLNEKSTFLDYIRIIKNELKETYRHQRLPFSTIALNVTDKTTDNFHTLHQLFFSYEKHNYSSTFAGHISTVIPLTHQTERAPLAIYVREFDEVNDVKIDFDFNVDILNESFIEFFIRRFGSLIDQIMLNPSLSIETLDMLDDSERRMLLNDFGKGEQILLKEDTFLSLISEQVFLHGDDIALEYGSIKLTYQELEDRTASVGSYLHSCYGIGREDLIGIMLDRSEQMVIAILGVLKSGGAYVPLDPSLPASRRQYILDKSGVKAVITQESYLSELAAEGYQCIILSAIGNYPDGLKEQCIMPVGSDLVYVMYTSGSTGIPKGVEIEHRSVCNFLLSMRSLLRPVAGDRLLAVTTYSFDISVLELFLPLISGGTVIILGREDTQDGRLLYESVVSSHTSILQGTPSMWQLLLDAGWQGNGNIKGLCGGERLAEELAGRILPHVKELWNMYGPTETTIWSTIKQVRESSESTVIGKPIANTEIYILNVVGDLLPAGIPGEIYIGGLGLARSYKDEPVLTSEKFIPHMFREGERLYCTGDIGKWLPDGNLLFIGRKDEQVKIRGYRIELGEIEHILMKHEGVSSAAVRVATDGSGFSYLVCYVVGEAGASELREYCRRLLPEYMVPGHFVSLETMPLNANGKVDKNKLPDMGSVNIMRVVTGYEAANDEMEELLVAIWEEVLERDGVGIQDNFFEIGGHSLKGMQIIARIHKDMNVSLNLQDLFQNPTISAIKKIIKEKKLDNSFEKIEPTALAETYELSNGQYRLWIASQFPAESIAYNIGGSYIISGELDTAKFRDSFLILLKRHEILRTFFSTIDGLPRQNIITTEKIQFRLDVEFLNGDWEKAERLANEEIKLLFDLSVAPPIKARLLKIEDYKHVFIVMFHHIIIDGWSMEILVKEIFSIYNSLCKGRIFSLPDLKIQYKDYAAWQSSLIKDNRLDDLKNYWLNQFKDDIHTLDFPLDKERKVLRSFEGATLHYKLGPQLTSKVKIISVANGVSFFTILVTAFKILLYKYTAQKDIIIGTPVSGRDHVDLYDQIGFYVNMIALRTNLDSNATFLEILDRVKNTVHNGCYIHQSYPFDLLINNLGIQRNPDRSPLFDIVIGLDDIMTETQNDFQFNDIRIEKFVKNHSVSKYDFTIQFGDKGSETSVELEYNTNLFYKSSMARMLQHFSNLLESALSDPSLSIETLDMLDDSERRMLLNDFGKGEQILLKEDTFLSLISEQVFLHGDDIALEYGSIKLTYQELEDRTASVGSYLHSCYGIGREDLIGIMLDRSEQMVIAILGVLKSGGAYVPLDPSLPASRRQYILDKSGVKAVITQESYLSELAAEGYQCIILSAIGNYPDGLKEQCIMPVGSDLVYVMYTSGSTGIPKGVEIEHRSVCNFLLSMRSLLRPVAGDRLLAVTTYSFDISVLELFLPLISGGTVIILGREDTQDGRLLYESVVSSHTSILQGTPSMWQLLLDAGWQGNGNIKGLCGGERLAEELAGRILPHVKELWNMYGPTETTIWSTIKQVRESSESTVIGKPIANTEIYILNVVGDLLPAGIPGEIYIGGLGLARSYKDEPVLTSEKFIPHMFREGERLYCTGDIGKWLPDGNLLFIGRKDEQVKIRGYRIELGEIEHILMKHEGVSSAAVRVATDGSGFSYLVCYVVGEAGASELREYCRRLLPEYMVPGHFVSLETMPLNANGKVDKNKLPDMGSVNIMRVVTGYEAANDEMEELLVAIWEEVLERDGVGIQDNFFEIGGHSLKGMQIIARIHKDMNVSLNLQDLFQNPTISAIKKIIKESQSNLYMPLQKVKAQAHYELSHNQMGLWIASHFRENEFAYTLTGAYYLFGNLNTELFKQCITKIIWRHEILRTIFPVINEEPRQKIFDLNECETPLQIIDYRHIKAKESVIVEMYREEIRTKFNLEVGPLLRIKLVLIEEQKFVFVLSMHHIITDGWSFDVFVNEFIRLYNFNGVDSLPSLTIQYKDYAGWQNGLFQNNLMKESRLYWITRLKNNLSYVQQPLFVSKPWLGFSRKGNRITYDVQKTTYEKISILCAHDITLHVFLMSVVTLLIHTYTKQRKIIIGYPVSLRDRFELQGQIGYYINTLALISDIDYRDSFLALMDEVKNNILSDEKHKAYPYNALIHDLGFQGNSSDWLLFRTVVVLQNMAVDKDEFIIEDIEISRYEPEEVPSMVDLRLEFIKKRDSLRIHFEYDTTIYNKSMIEELRIRFLTILNVVLSEPQNLIADIVKEYLNDGEDNDLDTLFSFRF